MIEVKIESIRISLMSPNQVVILKEIDGPRCLPVFIGKPEGDAITFKLNHVEVPRPLSHDLAASMIESLEAKVSHVLIKELRGSHFIAALHFQGGSGDARGDIEIDARPSDAIAIAVRVSCPIFVDDAVMSAAGVVPPTDASAGDDDLGAFSDFIGSLDLGDLDDEDTSR